MLRKPLDLRLKSDYDPWIIGQNIAKVTELAIDDDFKISQRLNNLRFRKNKWEVLNYYSRFLSPLGAVLYYTQSTFNNGKSNAKLAAIAHELGIDVEWVMGFYSVGMTYPNADETVKKICKRKSKKGQYARDGIEIGCLFRYAYDTALFSYKRTDEQLFITHDWQDFEHVDKINKLGINPLIRILKCKKCLMYGAFRQNSHNSVYVLTKDINSYNYVADKKCYETCEELMIREILE